MNFEEIKNMFESTFEFLRIKLEGSFLEIYTLDNDLIIIYNLDIYCSYELLNEINNNLDSFNTNEINNFTFMKF